MYKVKPRIYFLIETKKREFDSSNNKIHICKSTSIPVGGNLDLVDGKIVITDTSEIHGACSVASKAEVIVSVLENA